MQVNTIRTTGARALSILYRSRRCVRMRMSVLLLRMTGVAALVLGTRLAMADGRIRIRALRRALQRSRLPFTHNLRVLRFGRRAVRQRRRSRDIIASTDIGFCCTRATRPQASYLQTHQDKDDDTQSDECVIHFSYPPKSMRGGGWASWGVILSNFVSIYSQ